MTVDDLRPDQRQTLEFARQAAESTRQVPLPVLTVTLDTLDHELGQQCLLPEADRPEGHAQLAQDVRQLRALHRYRMTLGG